MPAIQTDSLAGKDFLPEGGSNPLQKPLTIQDSLTPASQPSNFLFFQPSPTFVKLNSDSILEAIVSPLVDNLELKARPLKDYAIVGVYTKTKPNYLKSHFHDHLLQPINSGPVQKAESHNDWQLSLLLVILFSIAFIRFLYPKKFHSLWNAFWLKRFANQLFREESVLTQRISFFLFFIFLVTGSFYLFQSNRTFNYWAVDTLEFNNFFSLFLLFSGFVLAKYLIHKILGYAFKTQKEMSEYLFNMSVIQQISGIGFFIIMVFQVLGEQIPSSILLWAGASLFFFSFLYQSYRGILSTGGNVSPVYFFLYFCTLEILPIVWLFKIIFR